MVFVCSIFCLFVCLSRSLLLSVCVRGVRDEHALFEFLLKNPSKFCTKSRSNTRFTLADMIPRLASDAIGGKSGWSHPTSRRDPIQIGRMALNAYIHVGWDGEGVFFITTPERRLHCTRSAPDRSPDCLLIMPWQLIPGRDPIHIVLNSMTPSELFACLRI